LTPVNGREGGTRRLPVHSTATAIGSIVRADHGPRSALIRKGDTDALEWTLASIGG